LIDNDKYFGVVKDEYLITIPSSNEHKMKPDSSTSVLDPKANKAHPTIQFSEPPQMLVWDEPYILGLVTDAVEVRDLDTNQNLIQTIPELQKARFLISGKNGQHGLIFAASISHLWCIEATDIATQRQNLLLDKKWFLALKLTALSDESEEDKHAMTQEIQTLYAYDLFFKKQFREAMLEFSKLNTDPTNVINLFPDLLPSCEPAIIANKMTTSQSEMKRDVPKLADKDLENGLMALIDYLVEIRQQINYNHDKAQSNAKSFGRNPKTLLSIIDTTLLKCYLETNDSFVSSLIRLNNCHLEESEKILKSYKKYGELIILYQIKGQHKRALTLLKTSNLFGYERTIRYLQDLGAEHKRIIFEFADWVIQEHPLEGLKIFTEDLLEVENLPRADVLDFLLKNHKALVIPYLEHIIGTWKEVKPLFHNILITQYKEKVFEYQNDPDLEKVHQKKLQLAETREKLVNFLKSSNYYAADKVLVDFPYNDLFEERAIVLGKLEKHEKVIAIYIQILGDVEKAIQYCDEVFSTTGTGQHEVYIILIRILLNPPTQPPYSEVKLHPRCLQPDVESVLEILEENGTRINPHSALSVSFFSLIRSFP
jgi:Vam6/Vps39-like protein vacuolar protein sorting-associated protein 39